MRKILHDEFVRIWNEQDRLCDAAQKFQCELGEVKRKATRLRAMGYELKDLRHREIHEVIVPCTWRPRRKKPRKPTDASPGSAAKVEVMAQRVLKAEPLTHPDDSRQIRPEECPHMPEYAWTPKVLPVYPDPMGDESGEID